MSGRGPRSWRARLDRIRKRAAEGESAKDRPPYAALFAGEYALALQRFERKRGEFWGHARWQSTRPLAGRAIAALGAGHESGRRRAMELGAWFEGGGLDGHRLALHALLGTHDRLEDHPPWPAGRTTTDELERLEHRNALLRPEVRASASVRLALLQDGIPSAKEARHAELAPELGFEAALRAGDLNTAETHAHRMAGFRPSWMDAVSGAVDVRARGALGLARVSWARGQLALVIKHVDACLQLASNQPEAMLLGAASALDLGLDAKAKAYHRALTKTAPFERLTIDDVDRDMVEARLAPRGRYAFAQRANAAFENGLFEEATRAYGSVFGSGAVPRSNAAWSDLAARYLFALASVERLDTLAQFAERILAKSPGFVTAREALAFTLARRGAADAGRQQYAGTGLEHLFEEKLSFAQWRKLPPPAALSPMGVTAESRAQLLLEKGAWTAALALLGTLPKVLPDSPVRFLVAGLIWHATTLAPPKRRAKCAEEAWAWLEPLAMQASTDNPYAIETPVLAAELLIRAGRFDELLRLPIPDEIRAYPALTMRAYSRLLPHRLDALLALARPQQVVDELTEFFDDAGKAERDNGALLARLALAERALGHTPTPRKTSAPHPDDAARALSDRAWTLEQRGRFDEAIDAYIEVAACAGPS